MDSNKRYVQVDENKFNLFKRKYEINQHALLNAQLQLNRAKETKAWKMMCLLRRFNEQFLKGTNAEKKKFLRWLKNKLMGKPIVKELELSQFSPIQPIQVVRDLNESFEEVAVGTVPNEASPSSVSYLRYGCPKGVDIFRFPVIEWDFRWQRPQQISVQFARNGHRVFYFSIDTLGLENAHLSYHDISNRVMIRELQSNVWWVKLCSYETLNAYKSIIQNPVDLKYLTWSIEYLKEKFNFVHTLSILDLPFWAPLALQLEYNKVIYDCMDDHAGFATNSGEMLDAEVELFQKSDVIITSSSKLYEKVNDKSKERLLIRNAGEFAHFSKCPPQLAPEVQEKKDIIIGYYGAISEWFDIELIKYLAKRHSNWTFVLVGDTFGCDISIVEHLDNVIFTGEKPYSELPGYLYGFDVCLIPFKVNNLTLATNPVKVYEYLSAGKPVVATKLPELEIIGDIVYLAETYEQFDEAIQKSINEDRKETERRITFASKNTWESRYKEIEEYIDRKFYPKVSIVIVTYNNWAFTKQCLDSLFTKLYPNIEIIVVDNASTDETRMELSRIIHPKVKVILSQINTGFAGGNAMGCQAATGDYIVLLNNDTIVPAGWVERLIRPLEEHSELGMVGPMSNSVGNDQMLDFFVGDPLNGPDPDWLQEFYSNYKGRLRDSDLLGFFCVAIRKSAYDQIGDLDTEYGIGMFEDDDYCERMKDAGYKLAIVEDAFVYHHGSVSFKKLEDTRYKSLFEKNKAYFEQKWEKRWMLPKNPASLFFGAYDAEAVSLQVRMSGQRTIIFLMQSDWGANHQEWQNVANGLSRKGLLTIAYVHTYHEKELVGVRKIGPNLYLTNRIDLFEQTEFDFIVKLPGTETSLKLKKNGEWLDIVSINSDRFQGALGA